MKTTLFAILSIFFILFAGSCSKSDTTDPLTDIIGNYVGSVHYSSVHHTYGYPYITTDSIDTTYYITFVVSKVSSGVFRTTEIPSLGWPNHDYLYNSSDSYALDWFVSYSIYPPSSPSGYFEKLCFLFCKRHRCWNRSRRYFY